MQMLKWQDCMRKKEGTTKRSGGIAQGEEHNTEDHENINKK